MRYVCYLTYTTDKDKIAAHRPKHREYLAGLLRDGTLLAAGPFTDDSGALFVYETDSLEAASALLAGDPFHSAGVFTSSELKPWNLVFSNPDRWRTGG